MYELFYIIPTKYTEDEVAVVRDKVNGLLEKRGMKVVAHNELGKHKLAYSVAKFKFGHRFLVTFDGARDAVPELQRELNLTGEVSRFMISHQTKDAKPLRVEQRRLVVHKAVIVPAKSVILAKPSLSSEELDKEIEKVLDEPIV